MPVGAGSPETLACRPNINKPAPPNGTSRPSISYFLPLILGRKKEGAGLFSLFVGSKYCWLTRPYSQILTGLTQGVNFYTICSSKVRSAHPTNIVCA